MSLPGCVLIVDDDPDILDVMRTVFEAAGYVVKTARNGQEALDLLRRDANVGLILLDLMMPGGDGWWFRATVSKEATLARIPIVVLSGAGVAAQRAASLGVADVLTKPVNLDVLLAVVARHCTGHPSA